MEKEKLLAKALVQNKAITLEQAQYYLQGIEEAHQRGKNVRLINILARQRVLNQAQLDAIETKLPWYWEEGSSSSSNTQQLKQNLMDSGEQTADLSQYPLPGRPEALMNSGEQTADLSPEEQTLDLSESSIYAAIEESKYFGRYRIEKELGRGGMGAVYKVYDDMLDRWVALKVILESKDITADQIKRFMLEARSMAKIQHPNIIQVYEVGETPRNYFTMDYIQGEPFSHMIKKGKCLPRKSAWIIQQVALALNEVHQHGIIHRDIKPSNIMLDQQEKPRLMDFGLVKVVDNQLSRSGEILGTPVYMSPEQAEGRKVDHRSDIYSLGASLYEALTQRPPFQGETVFKIIYQIAQEDPLTPRLLNPDIPPELEAICLKCLEKSPEKRYSTGALFAQDLDNFLKDRPILAKPPNHWSRVQKWCLRNKALSAALLVILFVIMGSLALGYTSLKREALFQEQSARKAAILAQKAQDAEKKAIKEAERVKKEKEATEQQKIRAENALKELAAAQSKIMEESKRAQQAEQNAKITLYYSSITLAQKFCKEGQIRKADAILDSEELCPSFLRKWEWQWLKSKAHEEVVSLDHPKYQIERAAISKDGKRLVAVGESLKAIIWNLETRQTEHVLKGHRHDIKACAFSPDGKLVATIDSYVPYYAWLPKESRGELIVWDAKNGQKLHSFVHHNAGTSCAFTPDSQKILAVYRAVDESKRKNDKDKENIVLWDLKSKQATYKIAGHDAPFRNDIEYCSLSPNGKMIATAGEDNRISLWRTQSGQLWKTLSGHKGSVTSCSFSSDGRSLVSSSNDKTVRIWDLVQSKNIYTFSGHSEEVLASAFSPDGKHIISGGLGHKIILWEKNSGKVKRVFQGHINDITSLYFLSPKTFVSGSKDSSVKLWSTDSLAKPIQIKNKKSIRQVDISPDGTSLVSLQELCFSADFWNTKSGKKIIPSKEQQLPNIIGCAYSSNGKKIALATSMGLMRIFSFPENQEIFRFVGDPFLYCAFDPSGKYILTSGYRNSLQLWNTSPGKEFFPEKSYYELVKFPLYNDTLDHASFSSDGRYAVGSSRERLSRIWDLQQLNLKDFSQMQPVLSVKGDSCNFSPDGKRIVSCLDNKIHLWEFPSGKKLVTFRGHTRGVKECLFTPDGQRLISASKDRTIRIWSTEIRGKIVEGVKVIDTPLMTIEEHSGSLEGISLSQDGQVLVSGAKDGKINIFRLDSRWTGK